MKSNQLKNTILVWFICLVFLPITIFLFLQNYYFANSFRQLAYANLQTLAEKQRSFVDTWLQEKMNNIHLIAQAGQVREGNKEQISNYFSSILDKDSDYANLAYVNDQGIITVNSNGKIGISVVDRSYFAAAQKGKSYISDILIARDFAKPIIVFSVPIWENGSFKGLVYGTVTLNKLEKIIHSFNPRGGEKSYLVDGNGQLLVPYFTAIDIRNSIIKKTLENQKAIGEYKNYQGEDVLGVCLLLPQKNWLLLVEKDSNELLIPLHNYEQMTILGFIILTCIFFFFLNVFLVKKVANPLRDLAVMTKQIAAGNFSIRAPSLTQENEIKVLAESFNKMADFLEKQKMTNEIMMKELSEKNKHFQTLAVTDPLTGLYNKRYLLDCLEKEVQNAVDFSQPLTVIMLDIDHFKTVNDTYGHQIGDQVLQQLALLLQTCLRGLDIAARYGGEEFTVVCPLTSLEAGEFLAERMRKEIEQHQFITGVGSLKVTVSFGLACLHGVEVGDNLSEQIENLLFRADAALYQAKAKGRNRVEVA